MSGKHSKDYNAEENEEIPKAFQKIIKMKAMERKLKRKKGIKNIWNNSVDISNIICSNSRCSIYLY